MTTNTVTYAQYLTDSAVFQDQLAGGNFPEEVDGWHGVWATGTCQTTAQVWGQPEDCPSYGVDLYSRRITQIGGLRVVCGPCGYPPRLVADFTDVAGVELENVHPAPVPQPEPGGGGEGEGGEG